MKQIAQNYKSGEISLLDVPIPACKVGGVLVRSDFSLISMGTEAMKINESKLSLIGKARARPDQVRKVMETVAAVGPVATYKKVMNRLDSYTPLGYSLSGEVVRVGRGCEEFKVGQRVACGGNEFALHAEYNWVPKNLCVPIPENVSSLHAAFTTVGAIAMQGFRQSEARLGEAACIIGLGLVGQILLQILSAAGIKVVGVDVSIDRCELAIANGAGACGRPQDPSLDSLKAQLSTLTNGEGADHIFLTAGGGTSQPVELAAILARDRARVVDIGKCTINLPWKAYYEKELDFRFSRSYGPGRYDPNYEERGIEYPIGYVRWTERRNMACVLDMLATGQLNFDSITSNIVPFQDAVATYERINRGELQGLGIVFEYPRMVGAVEEQTKPIPIPGRHVHGPRGERVGLGVIGCGNYATTMLLPHLKERADVDLVGVATTTSLSAASAQTKFGFRRVTTDYQALLADPEIDAILIATRHDSHAELVCDAIAAGKTVFVEKPLAVSSEQLATVRDSIHATGNDRIMVGFNRRFAKILIQLRDLWGACTGAQVVNYTVNAGPLEPGSWYGDSRRQGTRFTGEGGHFIDTISWWIGADPVTVQALATPDDPDNLVVLVSYPDGSIAKIAYVTTGDPRYPKEFLEVFCDGKVARMENFRRAELWRGGKRRRFRGVVPDKGQKRELEAFIDAVKSGGAMPVAPQSLIATTACTLTIGKSIVSGAVEQVNRWSCPTEQDINEDLGHLEVRAAL